MKTLGGHATQKILVTGGAGFIGSHLVDRLMANDYHVKVLDNMSQGDWRNIQRWLQNERFTMIKGDLKNAQDVETAVKNVDVVYHLAANPEVRMGQTNPAVLFNANLVTTFNLLEALRKKPSATMLIFTSTSTVYGDALVFPTPEDYGPLIPISTYGASKLACEALALSYAHSYGIRTLILRLANVVGARATHGVIVDFIRKLHQNPTELEILGDGSQKKSYLYIDDCVDAVLHVTQHFLNTANRADVYNIGSADQIEVKRIAEIIVEAIGVDDVKFVFSGGVDGGRGWIGDVKHMHLAINKLVNTGWTPKHPSESAVQLSVKNVQKRENAKQTGSSTF